MFEKRVTRREGITVVGSGDELSFPVGTKFVLDGTIYSVKDSSKDGPTEMRTLASVEHGEEVLTLASLINLASQSKEFKVIEKES